MKNILLIEDNLGDVRLIEETFRESKIRNWFNAVQDGIQAMDFLHREGEYADAPRPDVILLDLDLPRKDGREVLEEIKADQKLLRIPVVVLTTSQVKEDVLKTYNLHANCYVNKSVDPEQFINIVQTINEFWLNTVVLPTE